ncbi:MAG: HIT family protein [Roseiflexaceae bacterium]|nr:HIT family protein [Roseiflexaceae bacterium]
MWDNIYRTAYWDVVHSYNTALPGWLVLVARRHIEAVAQLSQAESIELGLLISATSQALEQVTYCIKTYVIQFAEAAEHPHVHVHIVPRMADQPDQRRGPKIFGYLNVAESERVPDDEMDRIAMQVRAMLLTLHPVKSEDAASEYVTRPYDHDCTQHNTMGFLACLPAQPDSDRS